MQGSRTKKLVRNGLLLSILLHLLLLLGTTTLVFYPEEKKINPKKIYVPAYVYRGAITPSKMASRAASSPSRKNEQNQITKPVVSAKNGINKSAPIPSFGSRSILDMSHSLLQSHQMEEAARDMNEDEPMLLIGDQHEIADPFVRLIGRALSAHFTYPRMAGNFGLHGTVLVKMTLNLDGRFTNVQMVRSSDNREFDSAALYAVNAAPAVVGADRFLSNPKRFVVQFIFD